MSLAVAERGRMGAPAHPTAPLILDQVTKIYGRDPSARPAVDRISLEIEPGEFLTFIGPSGCGKTTLLRMIAGLEVPSRGRILLGAEDITALPAARRDTRMMFQDYALFPHLTVAQNVGFGLRLACHRGRWSEAEIRDRIERHLVMLQIQGFADRKPHQLSGGQRQRVALARALVTEPSVLLFDEPLGALDANLRRAVQFELKRLHLELGKTFLCVTHDQTEAMAMSDRVAVMQGGRIEQIDTPEALYHSPISRYVARFVGNANVLEAVMAGSDPTGLGLILGGGQRLSLSRQSLPAEAAAEPLPAEGQPVAVMIRPEHLRPLGPEEVPAAGEGVLSGHVVECLFAGMHREAQVALGSDPAAGRLSVSLPASRPAPEPGSLLRLAIPAHQIRILTR